MSQDSVRVVVCGDEYVGKSSLILSMVRQNFNPNIQHVLPPITISVDDYSTISNEDQLEEDEVATREFVEPSNFYRSSVPNTTIIIDTDSSDSSSVHNEVKRADVILLIYSDHYTYERISLHWMPFFRSMGVNLPIVLCNNKNDLSLEVKKSQNADEFMPLINEFKEIEACVRCSAQSGENVVECLYLCQRAVTHPISPLYDSKESTLKRPAVNALRRIFLLSDKDQDGYLNQKEFTELHQKCFDKELATKDFEDILTGMQNVWDSPTSSNKSNKDHASIISLQAPTEQDSSGNVLISQAGFIFLNQLYAENGRHETIWGILRAFHYTNSLSMNEKFLHPAWAVSSKSSVELSPTGYRFLVDLFIKFDIDNDGGLSEVELDSLFQTTPGIPNLWQEFLFPSSIVRNEKGYVSLQGWLAQWNLTTYMEYTTTLEYLAYLGFDEDSTLSAVKSTRPRKRRQRSGKFYRLAVNDRNVFNCFVLGSPKAGKSSLLELFLRGTYSKYYSPTIRPRVCAKDIELRGGKQCYLIMEELGELESAILENKERLNKCDVICYTYDSSDPESFQYLVDLRQKFANTLDEIPCVFVALKADLDKQQQRCDVQPENYTRQLFLDSPLHISSNWTTSLNELFIQLVDAAKSPSQFTPGLESEPESINIENAKYIIVAGSVITVAALASIWIWKNSLQSSRV